MSTASATTFQPESAAPLQLGNPDIYSAWDEVYRDNASSVYRQIFARVGNAADAEELTAEVFMATLKPLRLPAARPRVRGYLRATARTVLAEHWRRHYGSPQVTIYSDEMSGIDKEPDPGGGEAMAIEILNRLPERARQILELRFLRGYSIREVAAELGVKPNHARVLQFRALRLAAQLGSSEALFDSKSGGGGSRAHADLAIDGAQMGVDRAVTQEKLPGDLAIGHAMRNQSKDHDLSLGEPGGFASDSLNQAYIQIEDL